MSRAQNRHDTAKWKKKRKNHLAAKCSIAKCPICHPHKYIGGNHKGRVKKKYLPIKDEMMREKTLAEKRLEQKIKSWCDNVKKIYGWDNVDAMKAFIRINPLGKDQDMITFENETWRRAMMKFDTDEDT